MGRTIRPVDSSRSKSLLLDVKFLHFSVDRFFATFVLHFSTEDWSSQL